MTGRFVEVINPNGQKGLVADTSDAARLYSRPKSTQDTYFDHNGVPIVPDDLKDPPEQLATGIVVGPVADLPALNASTEIWRAYAVSLAGGMSEEDAAALSRDELAEHFTNPSEED